MHNRSLLRWSGMALAFGGALTGLLNVLFTPFLSRGDAVATVLSSAFLWRQGTSAIAAAALMFGSIGLYLLQSDRAGAFGATAFVLALLGSALLLATEWTQIFDTRDLAMRAPATLRALDAKHGPTLADGGAILALATFTLGWIALSIATMRAAVLPRRGAALVIAGLFAIPLLQAAFSTAGAIAGNVILGSGWCLLGLDVASHTTADEHSIAAGPGGAAGHNPRAES